MTQDPASSEKNPFEVLGLQGDEDLPTIRKAFLRVAAVSHPDRLRAKSPEEKAQALEVFLGAKKAFELLSQPDKRREWSERLRPPAPARTPPPVSAPPVAPRPGPAQTPPPGALPVAAPPGGLPRTVSSGTRPVLSTDTAVQQLYRLGLLALEGKDYAKALDLFTKAAKLAPTPRHQALELVSRGHQFLSTRFFDRARESFEQALRILPSCREAQVSLEVLEDQQSRYNRRR
jgi:tetratricopeptide (TPR) repeat protein